MSAPIELLIVGRGTRLRLGAPEVGRFTGALPHGAAVVPGQAAGFLLRLGRSFELRVPDGASGVIVSSPPDLVRAPVGFGDVLYELAPAAAAGPVPSPVGKAREEPSGALVLRSPQAGRFYHRPAPGEPAFAAVGEVVEDGRAVGLIEVMKTFNHVAYRAGGVLPRRARIARMLAADGADVKQGEPLLEVEPA